MKTRLVTFVIVILCVISAIFSGVLSVYRSEGKIFHEEMQKYINVIVETFSQE